MVFRTVDGFLALPGEEALTPAEVMLVQAVRAGERCVISRTRPARATTDNPVRASLPGCLCDSKAMRRFAGIKLGDDRIPDGPQGPWPRWGRVSPKDAILNFRHLPERHGLSVAFLAEVAGHLPDTRNTLRLGALQNATVTDVPSATKNKAATCVSRNRFR